MFKIKLQADHEFKVKRIMDFSQYVNDEAVRKRWELWIEILRSDEYVQGRKSLRTLNEGYCCLGVACDLLVQKKIEGPEARWEKPENGSYNMFVISDINAEYFETATFTFSPTMLRLFGMKISLYSFPQILETTEGGKYSVD